MRIKYVSRFFFYCVDKHIKMLCRKKNYMPPFMSLRDRKYGTAMFWKQQNYLSILTFWLRPQHPFFLTYRFCAQQSSCQVVSGHPQHMCNAVADSLCAILRCLFDRFLCHAVSLSLLHIKIDLESWRQNGARCVVAQSHRPNKKNIFMCVSM